MPFPFAALAVFAGLKTVGAALNFGAQRSQANAIEREGEMERALFGRNAELSEKQAEDARARGREAEVRQLIRMRMLTGEQRAGFAGSGVNVNVGSAVQVAQSDRRMGEFDRLMIRENAAREATGYEMQADIYRERGDMAYRAARNRAKAKRWESVGTLINYGADMWGLYKGIN